MDCAKIHDWLEGLQYLQRLRHWHWRRCQWSNPGWYGEICYHPLTPHTTTMTMTMLSLDLFYYRFYLVYWPPTFVYRSLCIIGSLLVNRLFIKTEVNWGDNAFSWSLKRMLINRYTTNTLNGMTHTASFCIRRSSTTGLNIDGLILEPRWTFGSDHTGPRVRP